MKNFFVIANKSKKEAIEYLNYLETVINNLKENELGAVVGGVRDGQLEGGPANYQYKASVKYSGYTAKSGWGVKGKTKTRYI